MLTMAATPTYSSSTRLFVSTGERGDVNAAYSGSLLSAARVTSYADLVKSQRVAQAVIAREGLDLTPAQMSSKVTAAVVPETVILDITATDASPYQAQAIAQGVAEQVVGLVSQLETPPGGVRAPVKATIVDDAPVPQVPVSPQPDRNIGIGVLLGLLLGLGAAVLRELLDVTVKEPEDVSEATGLAVMGDIAFDPATAKQPLGALDPHAMRAEAFRVLRTNMRYVDVDHDNRIFTVTSALPQEGKTTTATNLAIVMAQAGQRVLLLEADLRRPRIHVHSGAEPTVGLTTVLVGEVSLDEAVQDCGVPGLAVLTSGSLPPNPSELLQSHAMTDVLERARKSYDVVIVDAPPLLPVTDAALLAVQSDGALLVIQHGKTTKGQLRQAMARLTAVGGRPLGAVLNMVPPRYALGRYYNYAHSRPHFTTRPNVNPAGDLSSEAAGRFLPPGNG